MMFMFQHLLWVFGLKELPPLTRLAAIYLASNGTLIDNDLTAPPEIPTREVKLSRLVDWIGCDRTDIENIMFDLRNLGFTALQIDGDDIRYSLPELADEPFPERPASEESRLSIYVISGGRGAIKVGISNLASKRLFDLQKANPVDRLVLEFEASGPARDIRRIEKKAHAALAQHLISNEWFQVPPAQAIEVVKALLELAGLTK